MPSHRQSADVACIQGIIILYTGKKPIHISQLQCESCRWPDPLLLLSTTEWPTAHLLYSSNGQVKPLASWQSLYVEHPEPSWIAKILYSPFVFILLCIFGYDYSWQPYRNIILANLLLTLVACNPTGQTRLDRIRLYILILYSCSGRVLFCSWQCDEVARV